MRYGLSSPCQPCKERRVDETYNCHGVCPKYIEYSEEAEEIRQQKHFDIESKGIIIDSVIRSRKRYKVIN